MGNAALNTPFYRENDTLEGNLRDGTGWGRLYFASEDRKGRFMYEGHFLAGKRHGTGRLVWLSGTTYTGGWEDDKLSGYGTLQWKSGMQYQGEWKESKFHGRGTLIWQNGRKYEGGWEEGKHEGMGILTYSSEDSRQRVLYEGCWHAGKREGEGTMIWKNGAKYSGYWLNGKRHGKGEHHFPNGELYVGMWKNGKRSGHGRRVFLDGGEFVGEWANDRKSGKGVYTHAHGRDVQQFYRHGRLVPQLSQSKVQSLQVLCIESLSKSLKASSVPALPCSLDLQTKISSCIQNHKLEGKEKRGGGGGEEIDENFFPSLSSLPLSFYFSPSGAAHAGSR